MATKAERERAALTKMIAEMPIHQLLDLKAKLDAQSRPSTAQLRRKLARTEAKIEKLRAEIARRKKLV